MKERVKTAQKHLRESSFGGKTDLPLMEERSRTRKRKRDKRNEEGKNKKKQKESLCL